MAGLVVAELPQALDHGRLHVLGHLVNGAPLIDDQPGVELYSISNRAEFEALVKKNLAMQQTDQTKKQQKRIPQITTRLEQIDKVLNKLYEDNALGTIPQDRYEQMSQKYSEEYYALKAELATLQEQLSAYHRISSELLEGMLNTNGDAHVVFLLFD